jgi:hypothetical protein
MHQHKRDPSTPNKSPSTVIRTTNRFEVLHNLDKEPAKKTNTTKKKPHKLSIITQEQSVKKSSSQRTIRPKNKEVVLAVFDIPVIVNGCVLLNMPPKLTTSIMSAVNT